MRVVIDQGLCQGHGRCYALSPAAFTFDEAGNGVPLVEEVTEELKEDVRRAIEACPERAISCVA